MSAVDTNPAARRLFCVCLTLTTGSRLWTCLVALVLLVATDVGLRADATGQGGELSFSAVDHGGSFVGSCPDLGSKGLAPPSLLRNPLALLFSRSLRVPAGLENKLRRTDAAEARPQTRPPLVGMVELRL